MASRVAGKIKLQSVDELLGVPEIAGTQEIEIGRIHAFPNHPFKVLDDEKMDTLVDSIRENGILNPVIVRPDQSGNYEMISGHRRLHAAKIVGLKKVPAIVKEMSDDEAIIKMVDANIQREEILPSERAFSFKMKMEAMSRQGQRNDLTSGQNVPKLTSDVIGEENGMSGRQVKRYIRLTELIPELLECTDNKKIGLVMAVDLSYLDEQVQKWVYEYFKENGFLKPVQVEALKNYSKDNVPEAKDISRNGKEVEAESVAYVVCQHYGINTSDYSFSYVAGWSEGKETPELKASLDKIRQTASEFIYQIDQKMEVLMADKGQVQKSAKTSSPFTQELMDKITEGAKKLGFIPVVPEAQEKTANPELKVVVDKALKDLDKKRALSKVKESVKSKLKSNTEKAEQAPKKSRTSKAKEERA
jgi:ParB family chromosome partitioning protein